MNPQLKIRPYRSKKYLAWIRSHPCVICGNMGSQSHHVRRQYWGAGVGIKPHDFMSIPLCPECHKPQNEKKLDIERLIIDLLMEFIDEELKKRK